MIVSTAKSTLTKDILNGVWGNTGNPKPYRPRNINTEIECFS